MGGLGRYFLLTVCGLLLTVLLETYSARVQRRVAIYKQEKNLSLYYLSGQIIALNRVRRDSDHYVSSY